MASATIECDVCNEKFDSGNHKPLGLTCGHTFCFSCITNLLRLPGTHNCPECREQFSQRIDEMMVNYKLIPSENTARPHPPSSLSDAPCLHQRKALDYLCVDCMELVCFRCIRGTHKNHTIELLDDLLQEDEYVLNSLTKIRTTMHDKLGRVNDLVAVSDDILSLIDEIINLKTEFQAWKDLLLAQKVSTEQDLQAWDAPTTGMIENRQHEYKEMLCRLKLKPPENMEIPEIKARLSAALKKCDSLQIQEPAVTATARQGAGAGAAVLRVQNYLQATPPQGATMGATPRTFQAPGPACVLATCEDGVPWIVTCWNEGVRAVASLANNIKPSRLVLLSTHTRPIPGLGELLSCLAALHTGKISLLPLDFFWRPAGEAEGGMEDFIDKFRYIGQ
ncbi:tripartite motif-containing protein 10-like isoform X2 [Hyalella azteca]|uniref:Tripartite motif-containing protein 10-like isoform X2 n=1 Tax=Hyalella azteca TaxID=294128 RepID=A0A979FWN7_HYAAZ|nr:tripartite motif-containing protein 10-like isoform X2 [Hyalella azteca]